MSAGKYMALANVPKDPVGNLQYRRWVRDLVVKEPGYSHVLRDWCAADILFYVNVFGWTYDPRTEMTELPFITWPYQDDALVTILEAITRGHDVKFDKSREMGASWLCLEAIDHQWRFNPRRQAFGLFSRNEDYVDKVDDPKTLFWKLDFQRELQPPWLVPAIQRQKLKLLNLDTNSIITGESTTGNAGRGDRRRAVLMDEFAAFEPDDARRAMAATRAVTKCRIFNFTPAESIYHPAAKLSDMGMKTVELHWSKNPLMAAGMYTSKNGELEILDKAYVFPDGYTFIRDGRLRSPWYDVERKRCESDAEADRELDCKTGASSAAFFDPNKLREHVAVFARAPMVEGEFDVDMQEGTVVTFTEREHGRVKLWLNLDFLGRPPHDRTYVAAADIAAGTGASNSVLMMYDARSREKVMEYADPGIRPEDFGVLAVAVCRFFHGPEDDYGKHSGAFLIWEAPGVGTGFTATVDRLGYRNVYLRADETSLEKRAQDVMGWYPTQNGKMQLLIEYRRQLGHAEIINRSRPAVEECGEYVYTPDGSVEHRKLQGNTDPTGARSAHGDRVMADAMAVLGLGKVQAVRAMVMPTMVPVSCLASRRRQWDEEAASKRRRF